MNLHANLKYSMSQTPLAQTSFQNARSCTLIHRDANFDEWQNGGDFAFDQQKKKE